MNNKQAYPHLFEPLRVKNIVFKNRLFSAPNCTRYKTKDGHPTEYEIALIEAKAKGGAAVITIGETPVTKEYGNQRHCCVFDLSDSSIMAGLGELAMAIKTRGAVASLQLCHCGKHSQPAMSGGKLPKGPSACIRPDGVEVLEMTEDDIEEVIQQFVNSAEMIKKAGFQMVQLHGGHGWLISQFLSPIDNQRSDKWGGSLENRVRFPMEIIQRIRERCGNDFLIEFRISGDDFIPGGNGIKENIEILKILDPYIDLIQVSASHHNTPPVWEYGPTPHVLHPQGFLIPLAEAIKKSGVSSPVIAVGSITTPEMAEEIIASGKADCVDMARAIIADPDLPNKARSGHSEDITPCIRCNVCLGSMSYNDCLMCTVNPKTGRYQRQAYHKPFISPKRVAVIGGGPGGLEAAITASNRGHQVTLYEASDKLGGRLNDLYKESLKADYKRFLDYLIGHANVISEIKLNTKASPDMIEEENYDAVICAIGGSLITPPIPGIESSLPVTRVNDSDVSIGNRVVVLGGGTAGCECALELAMDGHEVVLVEMKEKLGLEDPNVNKNMVYSLPLLFRMRKMDNLKILTQTMCTKIENQSVYVKDTDGKEASYAYDTVVCAAGVKNQIDEAESFRFTSPNFYEIGDCISVARVTEAVQMGFYAAMDIQ